MFLAFRGRGQLAKKGGMMIGRTFHALEQTAVHASGSAGSAVNQTPNALATGIGTPRDESLPLVRAGRLCLDITDQVRAILAQSSDC